MIKNLFLIALGGGAGSVVRYICQKWFSEQVPGAFPWGTFVVNLSGCLLIGVLYAAIDKFSPASIHTRLFLITGFCGGFTTFSAFALENMNLLKQGDLVHAGLYAVGSVVLGVAGVLLGISIVRAF
jgi:fluoride exporter